MREGFNKPGARGIIKTKKCPTCNGRGTKGLTTNPTDHPCKTCHGTGEVFTSRPYPGMKFPYKTDTDSAEITDQVIDAVDKGMAIPGLKPDQQIELKKHVRNLPPAKIAHLAKSLTEMIDEVAEEQFCPKCKINVVPENGACPECGNRSLEPELHEDGNSTGAIGGYNAPLGAGYKTDKHGIKHNFKVREMKSLRKLVKEVEKKKKLGIDLGTVESSFTSFLEKKSKSGELQKQFGPGYSPAKLMLWIKSETDKEGINVSPDYLNKFASRLNGNAKHDVFVAYSASLKGAGLGVAEDESY